MSGTAWSRMPEVECVQQLRAFGTPDREVRLFLTFVSAMDRARDAGRLFESHPEVFDPARVTSMAAEELSALGQTGTKSPGNRGTILNVT